MARFECTLQHNNKYQQHRIEMKCIQNRVTDLKHQKQLQNYNKKNYKISKMKIRNLMFHCFSVFSHLTHTKGDENVNCWERVFFLLTNIQVVTINHLSMHCAILIPAFNYYEAEDFLRTSSNVKKKQLYCY